MAAKLPHSEGVSFSHPDKLYFPDAGITKGDLIEFYDRISEMILPHMKERPLTMHRFPDGIDGTDFFQQNASDYFPDWIETVEIPKREGGTARHVVCNTKETLLYLANQGCITPHVWLSTTNQLNEPDRMILDLDPPDGPDGFEKAVSAARILRDRLTGQYGLVPYVMATGSAGLHVVVPIEPDFGFDQVRETALKIAKSVVEENPDFTTTEIRKEKRNGKVFLDTVRNSYGQTTVVPYSVRPKPGAPVATPLDWEELGKSGLTSRSYTMKNIFRRLSQKDDPWMRFDSDRKPLRTGS